MAIRGSTVQWASEGAGTSVTSITVDNASPDDHGEAWVAPKAGNLLIGNVVINGTNASQPVTAPAGFSVIQDHDNTFFHQKGGLYWKVSDGTETSFTFSIPSNPFSWRCAVYEFSSEDLDLSAVGASNENTAEVGDTGATSISTNSATPGVSEGGLAIARLSINDYSNWTPTSLTNSYVWQQDPTEIGAVASISLATKVLPDNTATSTTFSTTDTGDQCYAIIAIFNRTNKPSMPGGSLRGNSGQLI